MQHIEYQIKKFFSNPEKTEKENGDIFYQIDKKTKIYIFEQSNNIIKIGIIFGIQSTNIIGQEQKDGEFYIDFQFQNDSLVIGDKFPWSSKSSGKVNLNSLEEIVLSLRKEWEDYNNLSKN
jgi:hypothetical protein